MYKIGTFHWDKANYIAPNEMNCQESCFLQQYSFVCVYISCSCTTLQVYYKNSNQLGRIHIMYVSIL